MQILVKTPNGRTITFAVSGADTVADVKAKIQASEGIPPAQQTLFSDCATMLEDRQALADCGIGRESKLHLLLPGDTLPLARTTLSRRGGLMAMACVLFGIVVGWHGGSSQQGEPPTSLRRICTAATLDRCLPEEWCRGLSSYQNTVPTTVDGSDIDFNCRKANAAYSWVASSGGFWGSDAAAFLAEVTQGLAGPYMLELGSSPGISTTLSIRPEQTVLIRSEPFPGWFAPDLIPREVPAWGSGGIVVLEHGAIWILALAISGETTVQGVIVIRGGTISGNITVQSGGSANISGSIVTGDLITQNGGALQLSQVSCSQCHHSMYMFSLTDGADAGAMARAKAQRQRSTFLQPAMPCAVRRPHTSIKYSRVVQP
jgi:hypothetical protein